MIGFENILNLTSKMARQQKDGLPQGYGTKLMPFKDRQARIEFVQLLNEQNSDSGGEGFVFEVTIAGHQYALKIVSLSSPRVRMSL